MRDQAENLRRKLLQNEGKLGRSIAVVSGKGGVGKSNFTTNFSLELVRRGKKVIIVDMDIGMGNIHILIGKSASYSLKDYLEGNKSLEEVMLQREDGLCYIGGGSGMSNLLEWTDTQFQKLIEAFEHLQQQFDYIVFDMGAGATNWSLDLLVSVDDIVVITTSEPTSITDAYSMMKYIYLKDAQKNFYLICNRVYDAEEGRETLQRLRTVMTNFLHKDVVVLGSLPEEPLVRKAVQQQVPFSELYPNAPITRTLQQIVTTFTEHRAEEVHAPAKGSKLLTKLRSIFSKGRD